MKLLQNWVKILIRKLIKCMEKGGWYDSFLEDLLARYPKKTQLVQELMNLLCIEQEAAYRRLRKDVVFHASEIAKIASEWNISLDSILDVAFEKISFQMRFLDYLEPSDQDEYLLRSLIKDIIHAKDFSETEYMETCNKLPRSLFAGYSYLNRFYLFRGVPNYRNEEHAIPFSQIIISEKSHQLMVDFYQAIKQIPNTIFTLDCNLFDNLIRDVQCFHTIQLITDEEKEFIREDLCALLDYLLEVTTLGRYPETKNKVNFFISDLSVDTNYGYILTDKAHMSFLRTFDKYEIYTHNSEMVRKFKIWMMFRKKVSAQISDVDAKNRIEYFKKQKQIVESW